MDFRELRAELLDEYYFWADKPSDVFYKFQPYYWQARGLPFAAAVTNLSGTKYLVSSNTTAGLTDEVRKALLFADHVVVRHETVVPHRAQIFASRHFPHPGGNPLRWVEAHRAEADGSPLLPCEPGSADAETARAFLDWTTGEGRAWIQSGLVTYVPGVIPRDVSVGLLAEGTNVVAGYRKLGVLPDDGRVLNERAASAISELQLPYLSGLTPAILDELMTEHPEAVGRLRQTLLKLIDSNGAEVGTDAFSRKVDLISQDVALATSELEGRLRRLSTSTRWERVEVELLALGASTLWYTGSPAAAAVTAVTAAAVAGVKAVKERFKGAGSLRDDPYFAVARLGKVTRKTATRDRLRLTVQAPPQPEPKQPDEPKEFKEWLEVPPDPPPSWGAITGEGLQERVWILCAPPYPPNDDMNLLGNWERARRAQEEREASARSGADDDTEDL